MPITGERTMPGVPEENYWFRRHEAAYLYAAPLLHGAVIEVGSGEGYGTAALAAGVDSIVGLDYDRATVAHAAVSYPGIPFVRGNLATLPFRSRCADAVLSLQVIEHVWEPVQFLAECRRVLRADGQLLLSTPNRLTFSPGSAEPLNLFHTKEYAASELSGLVASCGFDVEAMLGLQPSPRLREVDARHGGSVVSAQLAEPPQLWAAELRNDVAGVSTADFVVSAADLDGSLDLLLLARPAA